MSDGALRRCVDGLMGEVREVSEGMECEEDQGELRCILFYYR